MIWIFFLHKLKSTRTNKIFQKIKDHFETKGKNWGPNV